MVFPNEWNVTHAPKGLAGLAQQAMRGGANTQAPPPGQAMSDMDIMKKYGDPDPLGPGAPSPPIDLPNGPPVGPPQPITPPFPGGQQQPSPIPPQMPPGMQFPIQDPAPAPPPIGQPAPIQPPNLGPPQMPMPPRPPQAPQQVGPGIDPGMFGPPPPPRPPAGGVPFDAELAAAQARMQQQQRR